MKYLRLVRCDGIEKSGHYTEGNRLEPLQAAPTVRVRRGKILSTDGPFAETKEPVAAGRGAREQPLNRPLPRAPRASWRSRKNSSKLRSVRQDGTASIVVRLLPKAWGEGRPKTP